MTTLGLSYLEYEESRRSNLAKEAETNRANLAKEAQNRADLAETARANLVNEARNQANLEETIRKNKVEEDLAQKDLVRRAYTDYAAGVSKANPWAGIPAYMDMIKRTLGDDVVADLGKSVADAVTDQWTDTATDLGNDIISIVDNVLGSAAKPIHDWAFNQGITDKAYDKEATHKAAEKIVLGNKALNTAQKLGLTSSDNLDNLADVIVQAGISPLLGFAPTVNQDVRNACWQGVRQALNSILSRAEWGYRTADGKKIVRGYTTKDKAEEAMKRAGGLELVAPYAK